ncbi:MAG: THUMP domain-containing protein [Saccharolobus sp.]
MDQRAKCLITTKVNKGKKCIIEILNKLLVKDLTANITEYIKNVLVVYSNLEPMIIYGLLISSPPSCAEKIYPFHLTTASNEEEIISNVINFVKNRFPNIKKLYSRCYNRGSKVNCKEVEIGIGIGLKDVIKIDFKNPEIIVYINSLENISGISFLKKGQEKFQPRLSNKI